MIFKPYKNNIWWIIEAQGVWVRKEKLKFSPKMITPQNKLAIVPNGAMANMQYN